MRFISILLVAAIIGYLVSNLLNTGSSQHEAVINQGEQLSPPKVPTAPQGVPKFEKDINSFMQDAGEARKKEID